MKHVKAILTGIAISLSLLPSLPAQAANGQITCDRLVRRSGYGVVYNQGGEAIYRNGRVVSYRYVYSARNRREERYGRGEGNNIVCVWNVRRNSARLINR